jgi:hypothetical protein
VEGTYFPKTTGYILGKGTAVDRDITLCQSCNCYSGYKLDVDTADICKGELAYDEVFGDLPTYDLVCGIPPSVYVILFAFVAFHFMCVAS